MPKLLNRLNDLRNNDVIADVDLQFAYFLDSQYTDISAEVLLAGCFCSYLYRQGDVCLPLNEYAGQQLFEEGQNRHQLKAPDYESWFAVLNQSPVVGEPGEFKPLILDSSARLYLHKLWSYEQILANGLLALSRQQVTGINIRLLSDGLNRLFRNEEEHINWQKVAAACSVRNRLSVISGGPGTGKTFTVARIIALLIEQAEEKGQPISIALAAPTGKAAARLQEAISETRGKLDISPGIRGTIPDKAVTLHQLLGARTYTTSFKHNVENPLPHDVVIIDEVSMVDQALMSKVLNAVRDDARLILLGDKDQLASVEAGSVLGDICLNAQNRYTGEMYQWLEEVNIGLPKDKQITGDATLINNITLLTESYRFSEHSGIGRLAKNINDGNANRVLELLTDSDEKNLGFQQIHDVTGLKQLVKQNTRQYYQQLQDAKSPAEAFNLYKEFRILAAHRKGPWGVRFINSIIDQLLQKRPRTAGRRSWYSGKPIIVNTNDYNLGLYNGDIGLCLLNKNDKPRIYFRDENGYKETIPAQLTNYGSAYALTIHKSQGSEFERLLLVLPSVPSKIVSRELIYTAITRARTEIKIAGTKRTIKNAVRQKIKRLSGLSEQLWGPDGEI